MDEGARVLWPERESLYELMALRETIGEAAFLAEKQGVPADARTCEWPEECFGPAVWFDDWPATSLRVVALDPSKGNSERGDYSAYVMLGAGFDNLLYVDADLARRDVTQMIDDGLAIARRFRPDAFVVETNQFQELIKDELERKSAEQNLALALYGLVHGDNKVLRIRKLTPLLRTRRFRFKSSSRGAQLLVDQLRNFPFGQYDDGPDALEMAVQMLCRLQSTDDSLFREVARA
jgi:predicted phage terminase large subunit-like protein